MTAQPPTASRLTAAAGVRASTVCRVAGNSAPPRARSATTVAAASTPRAEGRVPEAPARIVPPERGRAILIAIDAGHGGEDPGAHRPAPRAREGRGAGDRARAGEAASTSSPATAPMLMRKGDYFIPLKQRRDIARKPPARTCSCRCTPTPSPTAAPTAARSTRCPARRDQHLRGLPGRARERHRPDRRRRPGRQGRGAGRRADRPVDDRHHGGEPRRRRAGAEFDGPRFAAAQAARRAGRLRGAEIAGHALDPGRDRLHLEPRARPSGCATAAYQKTLARAIFDGLGDYFLSTPPPGTQVALAAARAGARPGEYVIAHGDTLSGIAERYRVQCRRHCAEPTGSAVTTASRRARRIVIPRSDPPRPGGASR